MYIRKKKKIQKTKDFGTSDDEDGKRQKEPENEISLKEDGMHDAIFV